MRVEFPRAVQVMLGVAGVAVSLMFWPMGLGFVIALPSEVTEARIVVQGFGAVLAVLGLGILVGSIRSMCAGVRMDREWVLIRSTWRKRRFALGEVAGFEVVDTTGAIPLIPYCSLGVRLDDGSSIVVQETRALSRRRATEAVAEANDRLRQLERGANEARDE
jgi:hypothetical protein